MTTKNQTHKTYSLQTLVAQAAAVYGISFDTNPAFVGELTDDHIQRQLLTGTPFEGCAGVSLLLPLGASGLPTMAQAISEHAYPAYETYIAVSSDGEPVVIPDGFMLADKGVLWFKEEGSGILVFPLPKDRSLGVVGAVLVYQPEDIEQVATSNAPQIHSWICQHLGALRALILLMLLGQAWETIAAIKARLATEPTVRGRGRPTKRSVAIEPETSLTRALLRSSFEVLSLDAGRPVTVTDLYEQAKELGFLGQPLSRYTLADYLYGKEFPPFRALPLLAKLTKINNIVLTICWYFEKGSGAHFDFLADLLGLRVS